MTSHDHYDIDADSVPIDQLPVQSAAPYSDEESRLLLDRLVAALIDLRFPLCRHDATARLHVLASLQADIHGRLAGVIADARDQDYSWNQIAVSLGTNPAAVRRRVARTSQHRAGGDDHAIHTDHEDVP